jgi:hypothetical protein
MPWLTTNASTVTTDEGTVTSVTFTAQQQFDKTTAGLHSEGMTSSGKKAVSNVAVTIKPPTGYSAKACAKKAKLSGTTDAKGKLTLSICGSISGKYAVRSKGAVPTRQLVLRVKGAAPMAPVSFTAVSPTAGLAKLAWAAPFYSGGTPVTQYVLTATSGKTKKTVTLKGKSATARKYTFVGLKRTASWTFTVVAVTKYGKSPAASYALRVA